MKNGDMTGQLMDMLRKATEDQLRVWNRAIVDEIRLRQAGKVMDFRIGEKVQFRGKGRRGMPGVVYEGVITKLNSRTIIVQVDKGGIPMTWKVSPGLLKKV